MKFVFNVKVCVKTTFNSSRKFSLMVGWWCGILCRNNPFGERIASVWFQLMNSRQKLNYCFLEFSFYYFRTKICQEFYSVINQLIRNYSRIPVSAVSCSALWMRASHNCPMFTTCFILCDCRIITILIMKYSLNHGFCVVVYFSVRLQCKTIVVCCRIFQAFTSRTVKGFRIGGH